MKGFLSLLAGLLALSTPGLSQFEGSVRMRTVSYTDADSIVLLSTARSKGPLFAAEMRGADGVGTPGGRFILRGDLGVMWIVSDAESSYVETPVPPRGAEAPAKAYTLSRTGGSKVLLGLPCEEWIAEEAGGATSRIWATAALGDLYASVVRWFDAMNMVTADDGTRWEREMASMKLFPMSVVRSGEGDVVEREEVLAVEKGGVPGHAFARPEGYVRQTVSPDIEEMIEEMLKEMDRRDTTGGGKDGTGGGGA